MSQKEQIVSSKETNKVTQTINQHEIPQPQPLIEPRKNHKPDTGIAWVMAIFGMMATFATWGVNSAYGVLLNYYLTNNTFPEATKYDYALIGGITVCLAGLLAPVGALLYKVFGFKIVCIIGIISQTTGWICASFATKIWQLYLTQGVLVGLSFSLIYIPATLVVPTWFVKWKAASMSICVSGTGLGGLVFSLSVNKVIDETGDHRWAMRMVCFVGLVIAIGCALVMRPRNHIQPPLKQSLQKELFMKNFKETFDIKIFKYWGVCLISLWFTLALVGYTLMLFTISSYATSVGLSSSQGSALTAIMNAAQLTGRPIMGLTADKIGRSNFTLVCSLLISILLFAFWINATDYGTLIGFVITVGLMIGIGTSLASPLASDVLHPHMEKLPAAWSAINIVCSFFVLVTEVIALALVQENSNKPYLHTQIFAGTCFFVGFLLILLLRERLVRKTIFEQVGKISDGSGEDEEITIEVCDCLLESTVVAYLRRMVHPMKI